MLNDSMLAFNIPEGMLWGDYFLGEENISIIQNVEDDAVSVSTSDEWQEVTKIAPKVEQAYAHPPKWCKHGNACLWKNCTFRHERCTIYDKWIANRKRGYSCRCMTTDPDSCKSPEQGGCKYDHRDPSKLETYYTAIACNTEVELWDSFYERGLDYHAANCFDVSKMSRTNRSLLIRSLEAAKISYEDYGNWLQIAI